MHEIVVVSNRGQITLPANLRKKFGIKQGGLVIIEDRAGELILKPAVAMGIELYSDAQIAEWDREDQLDSAEQATIMKLCVKQ
jgi:AbrB family looped-hinge helix DNA binding protein